jgi:hypothetical protein
LGWLQLGGGRRGEADQQRHRQGCRGARWAPPPRLGAETFRGSLGLGHFVGFLKRPLPSNNQQFTRTRALRRVNSIDGFVVTVSIYE